MVTHTQAANRQAEAASWWPSRYGQDDEAGALNEILPGKVLEAVGLVREGRVYDLAHAHRRCTLPEPFRCKAVCRSS